MNAPEYFGKWTNTEERVEEMSCRLAAWGCNPEYSKGIWEDAEERFVSMVANADNPLDLDAEAVLQCFEDALDAADHIMAQTRNLGKGIE